MFAYGGQPTAQDRAESASAGRIGGRLPSPTAAREVLLTALGGSAGPVDPLARSAGLRTESGSPMRPDGRFTAQSPWPTRASVFARGSGQIRHFERRPDPVGGSLLHPKRRDPEAKRRRATGPTGPGPARRSRPASRPRPHRSRPPSRARLGGLDRCGLGRLAGLDRRAGPGPVGRRPSVRRRFASGSRRFGWRSDPFTGSGRHSKWRLWPESHAKASLGGGSELCAAERPPGRWGEPDSVLNPAERASGSTGPADPPSAVRSTSLAAVGLGNRPPIRPADADSARSWAVGCPP